ncbi:hypothetical protein BKA82DRAFT_4338062 [Pisolithus tinctorius]|nr:hypothetical protein BKA82DRAFT_4338062 [Pisolithus tinctorius]
MPNQWKPNPPVELIEPHVQRLWKACFNDCQILAELRKHIDLSQYGIGLTRFVAIRKSLGLVRTRQQAHTPETIRDAMIKLQEMYPNAGTREMISLIFFEHDMSVSWSTMQSYFATYEPHLVRHRKARRLQRRRFWAAGVNDIWPVDQHDKWLRFGLGLHTGIEPFSGQILWMKVWHSNCNPQLILSYYLETVTEFGFIPMVTQSDPGTENFGIANTQTMLRQLHDPALRGFVQHRWMRTKKNIMPEIIWSQLRRRFTPGFETLLDEGLDEGWYDPDNTLQLMVFRWLFIPWLQRELDQYRDRVNNSRKRRDKNKVLPHGIPELIHTCAEDYGALDFKVMVDPKTIEDVRQLYIKADHPVFDLVPHALNAFIDECYIRLGSPSVQRNTIWAIYLDLLSLLQQQPDIVPIVEGATSDNEEQNDDVPLIDGLQDLIENDQYMGGLGNGMGLQEEHVRALQKLERDEEEVDGADDMEVPGAFLWVDRFSDVGSDDEASDVEASL